MTLPRQIRWLVRSRSGLLALMLVVASGLMLGYFVSRTLINRLSPIYTLDFGTAYWIEAPQFTPTADFRREIFMSSPVEQAWIQIAASDFFELSINGRIIGKQEFVSTRVAGLYDLKT